MINRGEVQSLSTQRMFTLVGQSKCTTHDSMDVDTKTSRHLRKTEVRLRINRTE